MCYGFIRDCCPRKRTWEERKRRHSRRENPLEKEMVPYSSSLAWDVMDRGTWLATVHGVPKDCTCLNYWENKVQRTKQEYATSWPLLELGVASFVYLPRNHMKLYLSGQPVVGWEYCGVNAFFQNSYVETVLPSVEVIRRRDFWRWLRPEEVIKVEVSMMGLENALIRVTGESSFESTRSVTWGQRGRVSRLTLALIRSITTGILILSFQLQDSREI